MTFATIDDLVLGSWVDTPPSNALGLRVLRKASRLVARATLMALYDVDSAGAATDTRTREALRDATCSQAATWLALDIDPAKGAADAGKTVAAKSIGSASIQYSVYASTVEARAASATSLSDDAYLILAQAGLITAAVS